ncbi:MAG TPA: UxaA family hydrolase [Deltaproteobacteria bacterium]|nr:UxaA family hydrolase [Deltaproteobacteria bacterium]
MGYMRPDGTVGIRNHVVVIPTVACVNGVARLVERAVPRAVALLHGHGCGRAMEIGMHQDTLAGIALNPNVAGAVLIGLGCETVSARVVAEKVRQAGRPVEVFMVQEEGGSLLTARKASDAASAMVEACSRMERTECPLASITLGLECGGSDAFSGISANPAVGIVADRIVDAGGTAVVSETTEMIGTSHILSRRAVDKETAGRIVRIIDDAHRRTKEILGPLASLVIAPGNMDGGMSSIQEKSLGCICKAGSRPISEVVGYGARPTRRGLVVMDGPGYDMESLAGLASAGCQLILFTTGRGTPAGFPVVPVIKIASSGRLFEAMPDDMDIDAGGVLEGHTLDSVADAITLMALDVMDGKPTKAEINCQGGIVCLYALTPSF